MKDPALNSLYVIGGVPQEYTPAQILDAVCENPSSAEGGEETVVDEVVDPILKPLDFDSKKIDEYLSLVQSAKKHLDVAFAGTYTRIRILASLIDSLWRKGHFRLGDLSLKAKWKWNLEPVGAASAFYESVQSVSDFMDDLGIKLNSYSLERSKESSLDFTTCLSKDTEDMDEIFVHQAFSTHSPSLDKARACPGRMIADPQSWIVFVPFVPCDFRLGGSLLAQCLNMGGGVVPQVDDADYFMDCFEVLRELVEDGIVISGATVSEGGLLKTVKEMSADGCGISLDLSGLINSYEENNIVRLLFAEIPGALIQIKDMDFDYLDAELLLQDVAYFPLGHPDPVHKEVKVKASAKSGIQTILESLIQNAEGED